MADFVFAGDFANEGERSVAEELKKLPDGWTVIANKTLPTPSGRSFEIDFIVIGHRVVFAMDQKTRRGRIHGNDTLWVYEDGSSERSPLGKIDYVAKVLAGHIRSNVPVLNGTTQHFVDGCIVLTGATERPRVKDPRIPYGVILVAELVEHLRRIDRDAEVDAIEGLHGAIRKSLFNLSDRPKFPSKIGAYSVQEVLRGHEGAYVCRAKNHDGDERILAVYDVSGADEAARQFYMREYRVLRDLRGTGHVPEVFDPFPWSDDDFIVVPMALPGGISLGAMARASNGDEASQELRIAAAAFNALARIHEADIVHRAISPSEIFVSLGDGTEPSISFTGFHAARKEGLRTIQVQLDELHALDQYAAPELALGYGFAEKGSDVFSLALVFLERMSGVPVQELVDERGEVTLPGDEAWPFLDATVVDLLQHLFQGALAADLNAPPAEALSRPSAAEAAAALSSMVGIVDPAGGRSSLLDGEFEVLKELGVGATAQTYLVRHVVEQGLFTAKRFLRPGVPRSDFRVLKDVVCPNIARVYWERPFNHDVHVILEYVAGVSLADELESFRGDLQRTVRLAEDLLNALIILEQHQILHRDIKPDNVILRENTWTAVLIDFGTATDLGKDTVFSGSPSFVPPEAFRSAVPPSSTDRYSVAVVLFLALTGRTPFENADDFFTRRPVSDLGFIHPEQVSFAKALLKAMSDDAAERYQNAVAFRDALRTAARESPEVLEDGQLPDVENPWVRPLRGLFRHSRIGNADNRWGGDSEFMQATYVPTALDGALTPQILSAKPSVVFLTGNPGDGKTAFLDAFRASVVESGARELEDDASGWEFRLGDWDYRACYDASEAHGELTADGQLLHRLRGLEGGATSRPRVTVLVAINDGRLAEVLENHRADYAWLSAAITSGSEDVLKVDLKERAIVHLNGSAGTRSLLRRNVDVLVAEEHWAVCQTCSARSFCPILANVEALRGEALDRLETLALLTVMRQRRHVTMRDMRSAIAYLLTGDIGCADVHAAKDELIAGTGYRYWNLAFGRAIDDLMVDSFVQMDPGRFPAPAVERALFFNRHASGAELRGSLFRDGQSPDPLGDPVAWIREAKRRLYFESAPADAQGIVPNLSWKGLLPYRYADLFIDALNGDVDLPSLWRDLAEGLGRSDGLNTSVVKDHLALRVVRDDEQRLTILKRFSLEEFELVVPYRGDSLFVETTASKLQVKHRQSSARLDVTLDLFELAMRLRDGLDASIPELGSMLEDLRSFKHQVLLSNPEDLVLMEDEQRAYAMSKRGRQVVVAPMLSGIALEEPAGGDQTT